MIRPMSLTIRLYANMFAGEQVSWRDSGAVTTIMHVADWLPTLCGLAGYKPPKDPKWDGADVWPTLEAVERAIDA